MTTETETHQDKLEAALEAEKNRNRDLEARLAAEVEAQRNQNNWILVALKAAGIGLWDWDTTLDTLNWTDRVYELLDIPRTDKEPNFNAFMDAVHPDDKADMQRHVEGVFVHGKPGYHVIYRHTCPNGDIRWLEAYGFANRDATGKPYRIGGLVRDITEEKREAEERHTIQQRIIDAQRETLRELGAPIIPLTQHALAMPLVGTFTPERAAMMTETLLKAVTNRAAEVVLLDVTGVPSVDVDAADALLRVAQAVRLLGAEVALTGIRPAVAQALVELGVDMGAFVTKADLQSGIEWAAKRRQQQGKAR